MPSSDELTDIKPDMHGQTAQLAWSELERFFAGGKLLLVANDLDLVRVAAAVAEDDQQQVAQWLEAMQLKPIDDQQAITWQACDQTLWAVVVAPWILVQPTK